MSEPQRCSILRESHDVVRAYLCPYATVHGVLFRKSDLEPFDSCCYWPQAILVKVIEKGPKSDAAANGAKRKQQKADCITFAVAPAIAKETVSVGDRSFSFRKAAGVYVLETFDKKCYRFYFCDEVSDSPLPLSSQSIQPVEACNKACPIEGVQYPSLYNGFYGREMLLQVIERRPRHSLHSSVLDPFPASHLLQEHKPNDRDNGPFFNTYSNFGFKYSFNRSLRRLSQSSNRGERPRVAT
jgi:hypothetical protein